MNEIDLLQHILKTYCRQMLVSLMMPPRLNSTYQHKQKRVELLNQNIICILRAFFWRNDLFQSHPFDKRVPIQLNSVLLTWQMGDLRNVELSEFLQENNKYILLYINCKHMSYSNTKHNKKVACAQETSNCEEI